MYHSALPEAPPPTAPNDSPPDGSPDKFPPDGSPPNSSPPDSSPPDSFARGGPPPAVVDSRHTSKRHGDTDPDRVDFVLNKKSMRCSHISAPLEVTTTSTSYSC